MQTRNPKNRHIIHLTNTHHNEHTHKTNKHAHKTKQTTQPNTTNTIHKTNNNAQREKMTALCNHTHTPRIQTDIQQTHTIKQSETRTHTRTH